MEQTSPAIRLGYEIFHPDIEVVEDFYVRVLGFAVASTSPGYIFLKRNGIGVGVCEFADAYLSPRKPPTSSEIVLRFADLKPEYDRVVASGWPIEDDLQDRPWGLRDFRIFDPTGQYIRLTNTRNADG